MFVNIYSTHLIALCTRIDICTSGKVKSGEGYQYKIAGYRRNRAYIKVRTPKSCGIDNS